MAINVRKSSCLDEIIKGEIDNQVKSQVLFLKRGLIHVNRRIPEARCTEFMQGPWPWPLPATAVALSGRKDV